MRIIALEEHMTTPGIVNSSSDGKGGGLPANAFIQSLEAKLLDVGAGRLADMDASGISLQVLSISASLIDKMAPPPGTQWPATPMTRWPRLCKPIRPLCRIRHSCPAGPGKSCGGIRTLRSKARIQRRYGERHCKWAVSRRSEIHSVI